MKKIVLILVVIALVLVGCKPKPENPNFLEVENWSMEKYNGDSQVVRYFGELTNTSIEATLSDFYADYQMLDKDGNSVCSGTVHLPDIVIEAGVTIPFEFTADCNTNLASQGSLNINYYALE